MKRWPRLLACKQTPSFVTHFPLPSCIKTLNKPVNSFKDCPQTKAKIASLHQYSWFLKIRIYKVCKAYYPVINFCGVWMKLKWLCFFYKNVNLNQLSLSSFKTEKNDKVVNEFKNLDSEPCRTFIHYFLRPPHYTNSQNS